MQITCSNIIKSKSGAIALMLFLLTASFSVDSYAQLRIQFNRENADVFFAQLGYITQGLERSERLKAQQLIDTLSLLWKNDFFTSEQKNTIIGTLEQIQTLRLRPWPEHAFYIDGLNALMRTREPESNFDIWHKSFQSLLSIQAQRRLVKFWESTINLFRNNIIYSSNLVRWKLQNNQYSLVYENNSPLVIFHGGDIVCYSQRDSSIIYNTRGVVDIMEETFTGNSGKVNWQRVKIDPAMVYATLGNYRIKLSSANWEADSVYFYNAQYFKEPLFGKFSERIIAEATETTARYPRFDSYQLIHEIKNLFKGIDFRGGFTMSGGRIIGSGTSSEEASISFYRDDSLFIRAKGSSFNISSDRIATQKAAVSIYLSGDSIYHPNIGMRYTDASREFSMLRDEKGFSRAPFSNSFHDIDMYCEAIYWNIDSWEIDLRMIRSISETGDAIFESKEYFSDVRYMRMQGMSQLHPLIRLRNFGRDQNSNTFSIADYSRFIRADIASVTAQLLTFSQDGFLSINPDEETITLSDKLFHYIASYAGRTDYDVIRINSTAPVNAKINMNNFDLHLFGIEKIPLSDQKNVVIHPQNQQLIMKKGRDMYFAGRIESGLFDFYGQEFFFNYDDFKIELLQTDSMSFRVRSREPDSRGNYSLVRVRTVLEGINGELLVDHPRNKSGQMPFPRYPIFNSSNESYVYYDRDYVQNGVYDRDHVHFKLIPFSIDSLDNATTDNIAFDGVFISTGIFPDFYDYLTVQKDYSLGFNTRTPEQGYPIYGGKATYKGPIDMSYQGLRADGEMNYLNTMIKASKMIMYPDSVRANADLFNLGALAGPVEFPDVVALNVDMLFRPHSDQMSVSNSDSPFEIFNGLAQLNGKLHIEPDGLTGSGDLSFFGGKMRSNEYAFNLNDFTSGRSDLTLMTADGKTPAISATNYTSNVHMLNRTAHLDLIEDESMLDFHVSRFRAKGFEMDWKMDNGQLSFANQHRFEINRLGNMPPEYWINHNFKENELVATHSAQDGLKFYSGRMDYNLAENVIHANDVKIIKVADAAIFPDQGKVKILEKAEIEKLTGAGIIANTQTLLHRFYNAELTILSGLNYGGNGMYDYVDEMGKTQPLHFERITVDRTSRTTVADAEIKKEQDFTISPRFGYYGKAHIKAANPNFHYTGTAGIVADCNLYRPNWFRFAGEIKKDSVYIPLASDLRNEGNGPIHVAMMLAGDSIHIYPAVLDRQRHYSDIPLISATGFITWDYALNQYQISSAEKLRRPGLPDNIITINPQTCVIEGYGDIMLTRSMGQFKMSTYGKISHDLKENDVNLDVVMSLDFYFLSPALGLVENKLNSSEKLTPLNLNRFKYTSFLQKKTNEATALALIDEFIGSGSFRRFPQELNHTFLFADLKMNWSQEAQTFYTREPLGVGNIERFPMNKYVEGYLELRKHRTGDIFNMVMVPSGFAAEGIGVDWFFFHYTNGIMQTIASNPEFNNMIRRVKANKRRQEVARGEEPFVFMLSSDRRPFDFVRSMKMMKE
jgi:hypothetical protein